MAKLKTGTTIGGSTAWHSGNDGASSGLDADLLDGQHGSHYLDHNNFTNVPDPTLTLSGDASGSATFTNLGNATLTVTVADDSHNHVISNVDGLQTALDGKEASFSKNTAFNKNFGTAAGTVAQGNDSRINNGQTAYGWGNHASAGYLTGNQTITLTGDVSGSGTTSISVTVADDSHNHVISNVDGLQAALDAKLPIAGGEITGALTISGSATVGTYTTVSQYHTGADNIVLKGNAFGISSIFFQSEKDGTNINHPSDFGFIQYHPYGTGTSGESNELIVGVSNDSDDHLILNAPNANGLKFRIGASATDYTVWHSGNDGSGTGLDADLLDGQHGSYYLDHSNFTNVPDPTLTLTGDASGSATFTNLGNATLTVTVADDSHNHIISNVDGLQAALDAKQAASTALTTSTTFGGDVSGTYNAIVVADDSHNHVISNVDGLQSALDAKLPTAGGTVSGNLVVSGNLTVSGTTTTVNTEEILLADNIIVLNSNETGTPSENAGIAIERGTAPNVGIVWDEANDRFVYSDASGTFNPLFHESYHPNADKWTTARTLSLTGAVTGSASIDGSGNVSLATTATSDPTLTLTGDASGSATFTNLGNATLTVTVANDSHTHDGRYYTESESDARYFRSNTSNSVDVRFASGHGRGIRFWDSDNYKIWMSSAADATWGGRLDSTSDYNMYFRMTGGTNRGFVFQNSTTEVFQIESGGQTRQTGNAYVNTSQRVFADDYHPNADKWTTARTLSLTGAVTGSASIDGSGNVSLATTATSDPTLTLAGDASGSATFTNLGNATLTVTVADDSHNHVISNVDGLQSALDAKLSLTGGTITGNVTFTGADGENALTLSGTSPTMAFTDSGSEDDFYIHVNSNNFYVLRDAGGVGSYGAWDAPHALQLEGDTNIGYVFGSRMFADNYHPNADKWTTARTLSLTGAVTGSASIDGSGNVSLATTATSDPTLTLAGDASGSATFTNLGNATLTVTVADDSHNHVISNVDGLQSALDGKLGTTAKAADSNLLDGLDSSAFLRSNASDTMDAGTNTTLTILSDDTGASTIQLYGDAQGTGRVYVGQNSAYGGGIEYNGDNSPSTTGAGSDYVTLWRRDAGTDSWTARNFYNSNNWEFRGHIYANTNQRVFADDYHPNADKWTTARTLSLTGAVTGSASIDGSGNVSLATTATADPTLTLAGDASGSATFTNLGNATLTVTVADDSHNHVISNVDGLQAALDSKLNLTGGTMTGALTASGGINGLTLSNGISGTNFNITGVNQLEIADPGEGIVFTSGSSGNMTLAIVDDASDNILRFSGTGATLQVGTNTVFHDGYHPNADKLTTARNIAVSGAVTGNANFDGSGNITISTTATSDPTLTLAGDASGSATFTNLGNATLTVTVADDSHNHVISNVDGLQTALDAKAPTASPTFTGTVNIPAVNFSGASSLAVGSYVFAYEVGAAVSVRDIGDTVAGSNLMPTMVSINNPTAGTGSVNGDLVVFPGTDDSSTLSGTWRLMGGYADNSALNDYPSTLWLRIS